MNITMIIECPKCGTKYKVIQEAIKPRGRTVHCTTCSNKWHVDPVETEHQEWEQPFHPDPFIDVSHDEAVDFSPTQEPLETEDESVAEAAKGESMAPVPVDPDPAIIAAAPQITSYPQKSHLGQGASFALLAASLVLLAVGLFSLHGPIERAWPPAGRLYQVVGMGGGAPAAGQGLDLQDVHAKLASENGAPRLTIEAKVVNTLKTAQTVPNLDASLISAYGPIKHWIFDAGTHHLDPGGTTSVKAAFDGANTENGKILLTFSADNSGESK